MLCTSLLWLHHADACDIYTSATAYLIIAQVCSQTCWVSTTVTLFVHFLGDIHYHASNSWNPALGVAVFPHK